MTILVSGVAGFIGYHVARSLLIRGEKVLGVDNINSYYSRKLKLSRLESLYKYKNFKFTKVDISKKNSLIKGIDKIKINKVCHLAAQAGVRYSLENPSAYISSNMSAYLEVLEFCRSRAIQKLVYASSSSVYGSNLKIPFKVSDPVNNPISVYAVTKRSNELMSEAYAHLFKTNIIGLRFFTVYGPLGRPDMAIWIFTDAILKDKPITIYNYGKMKRDFTYIDDVVKGTLSALDYEFKDGDKKNHKIFNLGNNRPVSIMYLIKVIEKIANKKAKKKFVGIMPGDVPSTYADISESKKELNFQPSTKLEDGISNFISWYKDYHRIN